MAPLVLKLCNRSRWVGSYTPLLIYRLWKALSIPIE